MNLRVLCCLGAVLLCTTLVLGDAPATKSAQAVSGAEASSVSAADLTQTAVRSDIAKQQGKFKGMTGYVPGTPTFVRGTDAVINVDIVFDDYGSETSWEVRERDSGTVVGSGSGYSNGDTGINVDVDVDSSNCYVFEIFDGYGDGICCDYGNGSYTIRYDGTMTPSTVVCSGGAFTTSELCNDIGTCIAQVGACCQSGTCLVDGVTQDECITIYEGDEWFVNVTCDPNPCTQPVLGACCITEPGFEMCIPEVTEEDCYGATYPGWWYEGELCGELPWSGPGGCPEDPTGCTGALYVAEYDGNTTGWSVDGVINRYEDFEGIPAEVCQVSWAGFISEISYADCFPANPYQFHIEIREDVAGHTPDPTNIFWEATVAPTITTNGQQGSYGGGTVTAKFMTVDLTSLTEGCWTLADGWIGIAGVEPGMTPACYFSWPTGGAESPPYSCYYYQSAWTCGESGSGDFDLNVCLSGTVPTGACCDDIAGTCGEGVLFTECPYPSRFIVGGVCADFDPACGEAQGPCCGYDNTCTMVDDAAACVDGIFLGKGYSCNDCPCFIDCTDNEEETCGEDTNGGCNMDPVPIFLPLTIGDTYCGTIWSDTGTRDTDWFRYDNETTETITLEFGGTAEVRTIVGYAATDPPGSGDCTTTEFIDPAAWIDGCIPGYVTVDCVPGIHYFFVSTDYIDNPCDGVEEVYEVTLRYPQGACCVANECVATTTQENCDALSGTFFAGEDCATFECPCDVICDAGDTPEGEPVCVADYVDDYNTGCLNSAGYEPSFSTVTCGETICGTSGNWQGGYPCVTDQDCIDVLSDPEAVCGVDNKCEDATFNWKDFDVYEVVITEPADLSWTVNAEFAAEVGYMLTLPVGSDNCDDFAYWISTDAVPCEDTTVSTGWTPAGTYWFYLAPPDFTGTDCGAEYQATLTCETGIAAIEDAFAVQHDPATGYAGVGSGVIPVWFEYPSGWLNVWFYDHPYDTSRMKTIHIEITAEKFTPGEPGDLVFAVNWSTEEWSITGNPDGELRYPPLPTDPPLDEALYIGRYTFDTTGFGDTPVDFVFDFEITDFNPEWVSIDVQGTNFFVAGTIVHECVAGFVDTCPFDLDRSGFVGTGDINLIKANYGSVPPSDAMFDLDNSGFVGTGDINLIKANYGSCAIGSCYYGAGDCVDTYQWDCVYNLSGSWTEGDVCP